MTEVSDAYHFQGRTMIDREGEKVGKIDEVYANKRDGRRRWALVTTGLFGTRKMFVPLHDATPAGEDVRVPLEKAHVKDAPNIEADGGLSESEERELLAHYDVADGDDVSGPPTDDARA
jgi:sporulation protein YlmC with PRC-barrel domain